MLRCIMNKRNGTLNRGIFVRAFSEIWNAASRILVLVMISEFVIGLLQTLTLIAWEYVLNSVEEFLTSRKGFVLVVVALLISFASYIVMDLFRMLVESFHTLLNNKLSEYFKEKLYVKSKSINTIHFENSETYNEIDRANNAIDGIISLVGIIGIFVMAMGRLSTLGSYVFLEKPIFALIVFLPAVPIFITRIVRGKDLYRLNYVQSEKRRECNYYKKCIRAKETKTLLADVYFGKKWEKLYSEINDEEGRMNKKQCLIFSGLNILKYSIYIFAIAVATFYLFERAIDVGMFALITGMLGTTHATIEVIVVRSGDISGSLGYARDYFAFLDKPDDILEKKVVFNESVTLNNVSFFYPGSDKTVLNNINLKISHGEKIALVGVNGAGKTTLAKIIVGLFEPSSGEVLYNRTPRIRGTLLNYTMVLQNFCRYYLTLRENVAFGDIEKLYEDTKLYNMLKESDFDFQKVDFSLDTQLGRMFEGVEFSGGEWQKIAIARGFTNDSNFVVLDEPNSGLDPMTESKLFNRFMEMLKHKTGIIVTHRLGIAALADRIIVIEEGKIVEEGTHKELMNAKGKYQQMFLSQADIYK